MTGYQQRENSIPSLDLSRFDAAEGEERAAFLSELRDAARRAGFFYITGHGIEPALLDGLMNSAKLFFTLPEPDKLAVEMVTSPHFRGYTRIAWERTRGLQDWREQIDIGDEQPVLACTPDSPPWTRLRPVAHIQRDLAPCLGIRYRFAISEKTGNFRVREHCRVSLHVASLERPQRQALGTQNRKSE